MEQRFFFRTNYQLNGTIEQKEYNIPTQNIVGHSDIAPTRKMTPAPYFGNIGRKWIWFMER
jgi:hypothetical protein